MAKVLDLQEKVTEFVTILAVGFGAFQMLSLAISALFPSVKVVKLGTAFLVLAVTGALLGALVIVRQTSIGKLDRNSLTYIVLATAVLVLFLFFARDLIPSIFDSQSFVQSMSIVMSSIGF